MTIKNATLIAFSVAFFLLMACIPGQVTKENDMVSIDSHKVSFISMGTVVTLTFSSDEDVREALLRAAKGRLADLEEVIINEQRKLEKRAGTGEWQEVSLEVYLMLYTAKDIAKLSEGAWTLASGSIIRLWGIGTKDARLPSYEEIKSALKPVKEDYIELREILPPDMVTGKNQDKDDIGKSSGLTKGQTMNDMQVKYQARLNNKGTKLDFGSVAKGLAVDEIRQLYAKYGIKEGLIDFGTSTIYAYTKEGEKPYTIGLKKAHTSASCDKLTTIELKHQALSTSGDYERCFLVDNIRYHHLIDMRTGYPANNGFHSVSIIVSEGKESAMLADILSTAVFVLGREQGEEIIARLREKYSDYGIEIIFSD